MYLYVHAFFFNRSLISILIISLIIVSCGKDPASVPNPTPTKSLIYGTGTTVLLANDDKTPITNGTITYQTSTSNTNIPTTLKQYNTNSNGLVSFNLPAHYDIPNSTGQTQYDENSSAPDFEPKSRSRAIKTGVNVADTVYLDRILAAIDSLRTDQKIHLYNVETDEPLQGIKLAMRPIDNPTIPNDIIRGVTNDNGDKNFENILFYVGENSEGQTSKFMLSWEDESVAKDSLEITIKQSNAQLNLGLTMLNNTLDTLYSQGTIRFIDKETLEPIEGMELALDMPEVPGMDKKTYLGTTASNGENDFKIITEILKVNETDQGNEVTAWLKYKKEFEYDLDSIALQIRTNYFPSKSYAITKLVPADEYSTKTYQLVSDATGKFAPGALITASIEDNENVRDTTIYRIADSIGKFTIEAICGVKNGIISQAAYKFFIEHENFQDKEFTDVFTEGVHTEINTIDLPHIILSTYTQYIVKVTDDKGNPLQDANAKIILSNNNEYAKLTKSDGETDQFSMEIGQTPKGEIPTLSIDAIIEVTKENYNKNTRTEIFESGDMGKGIFELVEKTDPNTDYSEQTYQLISDKTGKVAAGASIEVKIQDHEFISDTTFYRTSDSQGKFTIRAKSGRSGDDISQAAYELLIEHENFADKTTTKVFVEGTHEDIRNITLEHLMQNVWGIYTPKAVDDNGNPLANAIARIQISSLNYDVSKTTGSNGETSPFSILMDYIPKGETSTQTASGTVNVSKSGYSSHSKNKTFRPWNMGVDIYTLNEEGIRQLQDLEGIARNANGQVMSGAKIIVMSGGNIIKESDYSGSDGKFRVDDLPLGQTVTIQLVKDGHYGYQFNYLIPSNITNASDTINDGFGAVFYEAISGLSAEKIEVQVKHSSLTNNHTYFIDDTFNSTEKNAIEGYFSSFKSDENNTRNFTKSNVEVSNTGSINISKGGYNTTTTRQTINTPIGITLRPTKKAEITMGTGNYIIAVHEFKQAVSDFNVTGDIGSVMNSSAQTYSFNDKQIGIMDAKHSEALYVYNWTYVPLTKIITPQ